MDRPRLECGHELRTRSLTSKHLALFMNMCRFGPSATETMRSTPVRIAKIAAQADDRGRRPEFTGGAPCVRGVHAGVPLAAPRVLRR